MDPPKHGPGQGHPAQRLLLAPVQTDCQYANPCLDCRFFITTLDFLGQHRQQCEETHQMIDQAGPGEVVSGEKSPSSMPSAGNSRYLTEASRRRHDQARDRAVDAARRTAVSVFGIAAAAGVSRSWLYTQDDLRAAIADLMKRRPAPTRTALPAAASDESLRRRLEASQKASRGQR